MVLPITGRRHPLFGHLLHGRPGTSGRADRPIWSRLIALALMAVLSGLAASAPAVPRIGDSAPYATTTAQTAPVASSTQAASSPSTTLGIRYVVVVVMENRGYDQIVDSSNAPYLNGLIRRYGLATHYTGVGHPSEPNYLALLGGSTFGVTDDGVHDIAGANLVDQLEAHGLTWHVAAEDVPRHCYQGATASGGSDGPGWYARKHEPAISFTDIRTNPLRCARIGNLASFRPGGANVQLVIPNFCHDMHDCSTATGDAFLRAWLPKLLTSPTFRQTLLIVTWDEGIDDLGGGGHVATLVISPSVHRGARVGSHRSHYSILRTIENLWRLPCLRSACAAGDLLAFLHPVTAAPATLGLAPASAGSGREPHQPVARKTKMRVAGPRTTLSTTARNPRMPSRVVPAPVIRPR